MEGQPTEIVDRTLSQQASEIVDLIKRADDILDGVLGSLGTEADSGTAEAAPPLVSASLTSAEQRLRALNQRLEGLRDRVGMI